MSLLKEAKIKIEDKWVDIKIPVSFFNNFLKKKDWSILDKVKGIWKDKKIDAMGYQKKIRQEWR
ncbi:MAG: hypothetical protein PHX21_01035 [bacterium]|nr:hypothetical protein [bacterium]